MRHKPINMAKNGMVEKMKALLALEDGRIFPCRSFSGSGEASGEIVFNTGMTGYQEILTDPSYRGQMVTLTYPLIGNYGINTEDEESDRIQVSALLVREYQSFPSNYRSCVDLAGFLKKASVPGIEDLDTRALTRHIRKDGAMRAFVSTEDLDPASLVKRAGSLPNMAGHDLATQVTTSRPYLWSGDKRIFFDPPASPVAYVEGMDPRDRQWRAGLNHAFGGGVGLEVPWAKADCGRL